MRLVNTVSAILSSSILTLCLAACGVSSLGGGEGGTCDGCAGSGAGGKLGGDGGSAPAGSTGSTGGGNGSACQGPNPEGCKTQGCPQGQICVDPGCFSNSCQWCTSSSCQCDAATGQWICNDDCGGGWCVLGGGQCQNMMKDGSETDVDCGGSDCPPCGVGQDCVVSSDCITTVCTGTKCQAACPEPTPEGCSPGSCPPGQMCVISDQTCTSSACTCNAATNTWDCLPDCGGGICVANSQCTNGVKDGAETDVDCGGPVCPPCPDP